MIAGDSGRSIRVGVSACLMGDEVRYNGGHSRDRYVVDTLADHFELVKVCPEDEIGMGTPRETVRLIEDPKGPLMVGSESKTDWTVQMNRWSKKRARELASEDFCGFIFKSKSPSCGVWRVKMYGAGGVPTRSSQGLFATEMTRRYPLLPVEEEGRLHDAGLRENFIERVFAYRRLRDVFAGRWKRGEVIDFHAREKYLLMAHDPAGLKKLGQLTARIADHRPTEFRDLYMAEYMAILETRATVKKHVNALQHMAGYLRDHVTAPERKRVLAVIDDYRNEYVPLIVPMTLLRHYIELHEIPYISRQTYLNPHPAELALRNHV